MTKLSEIPVEFQSNYILYRLAESLGYNTRKGTEETGRIIEADIDSVLDEALSIIRFHRFEAY